MSGDPAGGPCWCVRGVDVARNTGMLAAAAAAAAAAAPAFDKYPFVIISILG